MVKKIVTLLLLLVSTFTHAADYYWVGGGGNWSEISHWATTSGGTSYHSVVPSQNDDVYFDGNSGFTSSNRTVLLNVDGSSRTMTWNVPGVTPIFNSNSSVNLNIYGSLLLQSGMSLGLYKIYFKGNSGSYSIVAGGVAHSDPNSSLQMIFDGNATWSFNSNMNILNLDIIHNAGYVRFNNYEFHFASFRSSSVNTRGLDLGSSNILIGYLWSADGSNLLFNSEQSIITLLNSIGGSGNTFRGRIDQFYNKVILFSGGTSSLSGSTNIQHLDAKGNVRFDGQNKMDTLILYAGNLYQLPSSSTQTVSKYLQAIGSDCGGIVQINSTTPSVSCRLSLRSGVVTNVQYALIRDVTILDEQLEVESSYDFGGNTNINFGTPAISKTLYWVGGAGNWRDPSHWSVTSGGSFPVVNGCAPTPVDNVVFDVNSGFIVGADALRKVWIDESAFCKDMTWTNAPNSPILQSSNRSSLSISGSLELQEDMTVMTQQIYFVSNSPETIRFNNASIRPTVLSDVAKITFLSTGSNGTWDFLDSYKTQGFQYYFELLQGHIRTNGFDVYGGRMEIVGRGGRSIDFGSSSVHLIGSVAYSSSGSNCTIVANQSHFYLESVQGTSSFTSGVSTLFNRISSTVPRTKIVFSGVVVAKYISLIGGADLSNNLTTDTLILAGGKNYGFPNSITVNKLLRAGSNDCSGETKLSPIFNSRSPSFGMSLINVLSTTILDIVNTGFSSMNSNRVLNLSNCIDYGDNGSNLVFGPYTTKNLYWVGGAGEWEDKNHWSLVDNGVYPAVNGCVPTSGDNVFFTSNSGFIVGANTVSIMTYATCNDMTWINAPNNPILTGSTDVPFFISGSVILHNNLSYRVIDTYFNSASDQTLQSNSVQIDRSNLNYYKVGSGDLLLVDDFNNGDRASFFLLKGGFFTQGKNVSFNQFRSESTTVRTINIENSEVDLFDGSSAWSIIGTNLSLSAANSIINLTGNATANFSLFKSSNDLQYDRVVHSSTVSTSSIFEGPFHANYLSLSSNSTLLGNNSFDTLILRPGKTYQLQSGREQIVNRRLYASGSPCEVIQVISNNSGSPAKFSVLAGLNTFDYTRVKDIDASNSFDVVNFEAHSVDMGGNTNLSFIPYDANAPIVGLGDVTRLVPCPLSHTITTEGFYGNPLTTYLWSDGSTDDHLDVTDFGLYTVEVSYSTGCSVVDSIRVLPAEDITPPLIVDCPMNLTFDSSTDFCGVIATWTPPTATDACQLDSLISNYAPGDSLPLGTTTIVYTAYDASLNSSTCSFTITVTDIQPPTIVSCPANQSVVASTGDCSASVIWSNPTVTDNCSEASNLTFSSTHASGDLFSLGLTTVTFTISDQSGNSSTCSFDIEVIGEVGVVVSACPANIIVNAVAGSCQATATWIEPTAVDGCSRNTINYLVRSHEPGSAFFVATTPVAYLFEDTYGNLGYCAFTVTVLDIEPPVFVNCPANISVNEAGSSCGAVVNWISPIATDNCGTPTVVSSSLPSGSVFPGGTSVVSYTAVDPSGNTSVCSFNITVVDVTAPIVSNCPIDLSVSSSLTSCDANVFWIPPTASDNCGLAVNTTSTHTPGSSFTVGTTTVIYSFSDGLNTSTCSFDVTVTDISQPVISNCPNNITIAQEEGSCAAVVNWVMPTAIDACSGTVLTSLTSPFPSGSLFPIGQSTISYIYENSSGNQSTCSFIINVLDTIAPSFDGTCPADVIAPVSSIPCIATATWIPPTAIDNCSLPVTVTSPFTPGDMFPLGPTTVTYTATDASGNSSTCSFVVRVEDLEGPVFVNCPSNIVKDQDGTSCSAVVSWVTPTTTDNCGFSTVITTSPLSGTAFPVGITPIIYTAVDGAGNTTTCSFNITIYDTIAPIVVDCPNSFTVPSTPSCTADVMWIEPKATDNCGQAVTVTRSHIPGSTFALDTTMVVYNFSDGVNISTCRFTITVSGGNAPSFVNCPIDLSIPQQGATCEAPVTWVPPTVTDNCGTTILTSSHQPGDIFPVGSTVVTYTVTSGSDILTCSFTVSVEDTIAPVVSGCPSTIIVPQDGSTCEAAVSWTIPTATDQCGAPISISSNHSPGENFPLGSTSVLYTFIDAFGNSSTCSFSIRVIDDISPFFEIACPTDIHIPTDPTNCQATVTWVTPAASDNCGAPSTLHGSHMSGATFIVGATPVTYTAIDESGNESTCSFNVIVHDTISPVISGCPSDTIVSAIAASCSRNVSWTPPTASDNCQATLTQSATVLPGSSFPIGETSVTYTFSDGTNSAVCTFIVSVIDSIPPVFVDCPSDIYLINDAGLCQTTATWTPPTATDGCGGQLTITSSHIPNSIFVVGVTEVVYSASDGIGNSSTCSFDVKVEDVENPVVVISDLFSQACFGDTITWKETITDNCGIDTVIYSHLNGSVFPIGVTLVSVKAIDVNGNPSTYSFEVTINESPSLPVVSSVPIEACATSDVTLSVYEPSFNLLYSWVFDGLFVNVGPDLSLKGLQMANQGAYTVIAENSDGCIAQTEVLLTVNNCEIFIPESFSPNGDGNNDVFEIPSLGNYPNSILWINNRWGVQVYQSNNYQNDWDGRSTSSITVGDEVLPEGTYYYILQLGGNETQIGSGTVYKGYVYLKP